MVPAPVGVHCKSCVATARKSQAHPFLIAQGTTPYVTYALIAVNVMVALLGLATSAWAQGELGPVGVHGGLLGGGLQLDGDGPQVIGVDAGEWYRIFTGAFIHAGPIHLGFNMLILWQAGTALEPALGRVRFAL
ncbi:MAG: rhomboid family intramembrane serine protease, partial [Tepidiformaceae bacterium]